jgi:hypothetical protein
MWKPQSPGTLRACPELMGIFYLYKSRINVCPPFYFAIYRCQRAKVAMKFISDGRKYNCLRLLLLEFKKITSNCDRSRSSVTVLAVLGLLRLEISKS